jgi:hypothetical protein
VLVDEQDHWRVEEHTGSCWLWRWLWAEDLRIDDREGDAATFWSWLTCRLSRWRWRWRAVLVMTGRRHLCLNSLRLMSKEERVV